MRRFLVAPGILLVVLMLALTACSGSSSTSSNTPTSGGTPGSGGKTNPSVKIGAMCDRSGPTANVGTKLCDGSIDYVNMINDKGGVNGRKVEWIEGDNKYEVPTAQQIYKKYIQQDKVVGVQSYGTPITDALLPSATDDKIPLLTPGFGVSATSDGTKYPYGFVGASSYASQMSAIVAFVKEQAAAKNLAKPNVVYLYYDNPAGRDPQETLVKLAAQEGLNLIDQVPVPPPGSDLSGPMAQVKAKNPDFIISHLFGKSPQLSVLEKAKADIKAPMISLVWGTSEDEIEAGGSAAEGYYGLQFTTLADENPQAVKDLQAWWQQKGQQPNPKLSSVFYARGMTNAALWLRAIELAGDGELTGENIKAGFEKFKDEKLNGMAAGLTMSASDHGGTRKVKMYQVTNGKWKLVKDWYEGPKVK